MPVTVRPTKTDKEIARIIARNTTPTMEETAEILTWGADEHVLCAAAAVWWLYCRGRPARRWRHVARITKGGRPASPDVLELVPELRDFVPPAGVIDRLGCGQQEFSHRSDRATASDLFSRTLLALRSKCAAFLPQTLQPQSCAGRRQQLILGRGGRAKRIEEQRG